MIRTLTLHDTPKHSGKTFEFKEGLNTITGFNGVGKSIIFESVAFALFGSQALRLGATTYPKSMKVILEFEVKGESYKIVRKIGTAELFNTHGTLLASGTKPVNAEVKNLLGYGYDVYQVSNYSAQEAVQHLATLKPTERKRLIDNVIGLTAIEKVIAEHKISLSEHRRVAKHLNDNQPMPLEAVDETEVPKSLEELIEGHARAVEVRTQLLEAKRTRVSVQSSEPVAVPKPKEVDPDFNLNAVAEAKRRVEAAKNKVQGLSQELHTLAVSIGAVILEVEALNKAWSDYHDSELKAKLLAKGNLVCEACDHVNYFAGDSLKELEHVAIGLEKPKVTVQMVERYKQLQSDLEAINLEYIAAKAALPSESYVVEQTQLIQANQKYQNYLLSQSQFESAMAKLPEFCQDRLIEADESAQLLEPMIAKKREILARLRINEERTKAFEKHATQVKEVEVEVAKENLAVKTLGDLLLRVKSNLLPSINAVASTWLSRMSDGAYSKVELTESMDILIDDLLIEAQSTSGRALGHLSLRMALGQVLTNSVFPVLQLDEVDASMRNERAQNVLDALLDTLGKSVKQIIIITHHALERIDHLIEV